MSKVTSNAAISNAVVSGKNASKYGRVKSWGGSIATGSIMTTADGRIMYEVLDSADTIAKWLNTATFSGTIGNESFSNFQEPSPKEMVLSNAAPRAPKAPKAIKPKAAKSKAVSTIIIQTILTSGMDVKKMAELLKLIAA